MVDQRFPAECRVRSRNDFRRAYQARCSVGDELLVVLGHPNGLTHARLGLSVPRKFGGAVVRNRFKRLVREAFRLSKSQLPAGVDLIVMPRRGASPEFAELLIALPRLAQRMAAKLAKRP